MICSSAARSLCCGLWRIILRFARLQHHRVAGARPLLLPRARDLSLSDCPSLASSLASLLLAMALVPVATTDGAEVVPMATDGEPAQARADAAPMTTDGETAQAGADAAPVPGAEAQAGVTATTVTFDVYMPQFVPDAFSPFTVDVPKDLKTAVHLKEHIIGMVCKRSGVYLIRNHAILSDRITRMPRPYNMPFDTLLESVTGKSLNLCLNLWTVSYRFALRYQAFYTFVVSPTEVRHRQA